MKVRRIRAGALAVAGAMVLVAGCSSGDGGSSAAGQKVTLDFWGWTPGYEEAVARFNKTHPDIQVNFQKTASGTKGGYTKMLTAAKAGNAPCLAMVGYETIPSFAAAGALQDVSEYAGAYKKKFAQWTWNQVTIAGQTFGAPLDTAPMGLFYRKDLFEKYGIDKPPANWKEYRAAAEKVHRADPDVHLGTFGNDPYTYAGLAWQAGAKWFGTRNDAWQVSFGSSANTKVAGFWQGLLDDKLLKAHPSFDPSLYKDMGAGKVLSDVNAVWNAPILASSAKGTAGKWAVAPMPVWDADRPAHGNDGGSATAVMKGCKYPEQATEFAMWMSTDKDSLSTLIKAAGIYPAATAGQSHPALDKPDPFYGGQKIYDVFKRESAHIDTSWQWGPTMTQASTDLSDGLGRAGKGGSPLPDVLAGVQSKTVGELKRQGLNVTTR
ncbi:sugar ABC transporter substrate-binding protein [Streptomyces sp. NPDC046853]|uniref:ABC transporter substrate-binding protein n=1 Tax=Streptomyces sp. NPDC046853 TaxID=3154920 RepID=UPI0033F69F41